MIQTNRRRFLKGTAVALGSSFAISGTKSSGRVIGANDTIRVAIAGLNGRGEAHVMGLAGRPGVEIVALVDPDSRTFATRVAQIEEKGKNTPRTMADVRQVLDDKSIDALTIATPNHWHSLMTIWACQAGKDVYVEKPCSHNLHEGRVAVEAARKYQRIVQHGTQGRSDSRWAQVAEITRGGQLGKLLVSRALCYKPRGSIGTKPDGTAPAELDYNLWLGPAPERPFNVNRFTFNWRYFWDYGGGQLADFVCHLVDPVHWGMKASAPETIVAHGERVEQDNAETPDELEVVYHYPQGFDLVWSAQPHNGQGFFGRGNGIAFYGTKGTMHGHYNDYVVISEGDPITEPEPFLPRSKGHHREWIDAIKSRAECSCNFGYGHNLTAVAHLGNMALKTGKKLHWDAQAEKVTNAPEANNYLFRPEYRAPWKLPEV